MRRRGKGALLSGSQEKREDTGARFEGGGKAVLPFYLVAGTGEGAAEPFPGPSAKAMLLFGGW